MNGYWKMTVIVCSAIMTICFGCMALQKGITPALIDNNVKNYCVGADGNLPIKLPQFFWPSLADAEIMLKLMDYTYDQKQELYRRMANDNTNWFGFIRDMHVQNISNADELRSSLFSGENSAAGIIMGLMGLTLGGVGGAHLISKPKDKAKIVELETKIANGNNKNTGVIT